MAIDTTTSRASLGESGIDIDAGFLAHGANVEELYQQHGGRSEESWPDGASRACDTPNCFFSRPANGRAVHPVSDGRSIHRPREEESGISL